MRIISGKLKGRHIKPPKTIKARPTTDFAKENVFNVLSNYFDFEELSIYDMYGGTGSISLEFASRGAKLIDCTEIDYRHFNFIRSSFNDLNLEQATVYKKDALRFVKQSPNMYDIIYADPPFTLRDFKKIPEIVFESNRLKENGWLIIEHPKNVQFSEHSRFKEHRNYGGVNFSFFY